MPRNLLHHSIAFLTSSALLVTLWSGFSYLSNEYVTRARLSAAVASAATTTPAAPQLVLQAPLEARAAVVYDPQTKQFWYAQDADTVLPLASITKLVTASVALDALPKDEEIVISKDDLAPEGDWGLKEGEGYTLDALLRLGLVASSNDAMQAIADNIPGYLDRMNVFGAPLGLTSLSFKNPTGLDATDTIAGGYGSARDIAILTARFARLYPQYFELSTGSTSIKSAEGAVLSAVPTAESLAHIPGFVGAKTGYTDLAGGNLTAVFDLEPGYKIVITVLGSSRDGRISDVETLLAAARATFTTTNSLHHDTR